MAEQHSLNDNVKTIYALTPVAAGTTDTQDSAEIDTLGYDGIRYVLGVGLLTGGTVSDVRWRDCATSGGSYADVAGTKQSFVVATDPTTLVLGQIFKPTLRYMKFRVTRTVANMVIDFGIAELYRAHQDPITQDATVSHHKEQQSPIDGTA